MKAFIVLAALVAVACAVVPSDEEIKRQWSGFKTMHGKQYSTEAEEMFRMKVFKENAIRVAQHNAKYERGLVSFKVGLNKYSDLHSHEVAEKLNGFRMELKVPSTKVHMANESSLLFAPKSVDWRKKGYVTPVKDQGQCGSCWSFSATGSLEGQLFKKTGELVSLSEQNLVDCSQDFGNNGCNGGLMDNAFNYVKSNGGIDTEDSYPYEAEEGDCRYNADNAVGTDTGFVDIPQGSEKSLQDALAKVGPISVAIDASNWSFQNYAGGVYDEPECSSEQLDHGVLAVGYGVQNNKAYWIVKNSWGDSWGENGYIRMVRNKKNNCGIATMASYPTV